MLLFGDPVQCSPVTSPGPVGSPLLVNTGERAHLLSVGKTEGLPSEVRAYRNCRAALSTHATIPKKKGPRFKEAPAAIRPAFMKKAKKEVKE